MKRSLPRASRLTLIGLMLTALQGVAWAHGEPASLAFWGGYPKSVAGCQRAISFAASLCISRSIEARKRCLTTETAGHECDEQALDAEVQAARAAARAVVQETCSSQDVQNLLYVDITEALVDVINICRETDSAITSAAYAPAMVGGSVAAMEAPAAKCIDETAKASAKLVRYANRSRRTALDRIAARRLDLPAKQALLERAETRISAIKARLAERLSAVCPQNQFLGLYSRNMSQYLDDLSNHGKCFGGAVYVQDAVVCPPPVCGNGIREADEDCDDANDFDGDGCRADCERAECENFPTTYDLIQRAIFDNHGCSTDACHGSARSGGLDLRAGASYESLIDVPAETTPGQDFKRVEPGDKDKSLLWINLAAATLPGQYTAPLRPMPLALPALSADELEAVRLWIETGGAAREGTVPGTAELLDACLPPPQPVKITPLEPPAPNQGVQLHMPAWTLPPQSESEVCFTSYYDFTGKIPAEFLSANGRHFRYKEILIRQDPLSHHLIVDLWRGEEAPDDPSWGVYTCKGGAKAGQVCNPLDLGFCGEGGDCATDPDPSSIACIGFGPQNGFNTLLRGGFAFAQETSSVFRFPDDVYDELPIKGVIFWNSHAFNLTNATGTLEGWLNIYFPEPDEQIYRQQQIFNVEKIFWTTDFPPFQLPVLAAFQKKEFCHIHTFKNPSDPDEGFTDPVFEGNQTLKLFEVSGHMHRHGKQFQIFNGYYTCAAGPNAGEPCSPFNAEMCPESTCVEANGRTPEQTLLYTSFTYNDPVVLRFDEPMEFHASDPIQQRSLTYCGVYDNGSPPNIMDVKRRSTSPEAGRLTIETGDPGDVPFSVAVGGPCREGATRCIGGPRHNQQCFGDDSLCDSAPGLGDGDCDACPLTGGFRTEDEMFILFGNFWVE
jgi:cysteine-rich repeat protein